MPATRAAREEALPVELRTRSAAFVLLAPRLAGLLLPKAVPPLLPTALRDVLASFAR